MLHSLKDLHDAPIKANGKSVIDTFGILPVSLIHLLSHYSIVAVSCDSLNICDTLKFYFQYES